MGEPFQWRYRVGQGRTTEPAVGDLVKTALVGIRLYDANPLATANYVANSQGRSGCPLTVDEHPLALSMSKMTTSGLSTSSRAWCREIAVPIITVRFFVPSRDRHSPHPAQRPSRWPCTSFVTEPSGNIQRTIVGLRKVLKCDVFWDSIRVVGIDSNGTCASTIQRSLRGRGRRVKGAPADHALNLSRGGQ